MYASVVWKPKQKTTLCGVFLGTVKGRSKLLRPFTKGSKFHRQVYHNSITLSIKHRLTPIWSTRFRSHETALRAMKRSAHELSPCGEATLHSRRLLRGLQGNPLHAPKVRFTQKALAFASAFFWVAPTILNFNSILILVWGNSQYYWDLDHP